MEVFKQYDLFKENCFSFASRFEKKFFESASLVCHPTAENELISLCSDEEAKSNGLNICRLSDMLLMSDDCENWKSFNLAAARAIAADKGYIYLTDLLFENAFYAEEWMINGKNDTIVVSEEYMREKGKKYAPVTPLTNKVLHFKKTQNSFFWKKSDPSSLIVLDQNGIKNALDNYCNSYSQEMMSLDASDDISFPLFDSKVKINTETSRALKIDLFFSQIDKAAKDFESAASVLEMAGYDFSVGDFIETLIKGALDTNKIKLADGELHNKFIVPVNELSDEDFAKKVSVISVKSGIKAIDAYKAAFLDVLASKPELNVVYPASVSGAYNDQLREIEQADFDGIIGSGEEKYLINNILSHMPMDFVIFAYIIRRFPEEKENAMRIAEFWGIAPVDDASLQNLVFKNYFGNDMFDETGSFIAGYESAIIIRDQLVKASEKYGFGNSGFISELSKYISDIDIKRRSYNGTVFDTPEDMKRAMANELELQALCIDLDALDEGELADLRKHINGLTTDETTKAKYLVKVKIAMNRVEESVLKQKTLGLALLDIDETEALKKEILGLNYAESVEKPFIIDINDRLLTAQKEELEKLAERAENLDDNKLDELCETINSERYDLSLRKLYISKINAVKDAKIKNAVEKICSGMEDFNPEQIKNAKDKLLASGYPERYTYGMISELDRLAADYQQKEAAALFENIGIATAEQIDEIRRKLADNNYPESVLAPYNGMLEAREKAILDDEIIELCAGIEEADQEKIDKLKADINNPDKKYSTELVEKYNDEIARRNCELKNSELAEKCKYIFSMDQAALDEIKEVLLSGKYDEDVSTLYLKKVTEREAELRREELDKMCENIGSADMETLEKLKEDISGEEKYIELCGEYTAKINARINEIKLAEFNAKLETVAAMNNEELEKFRADTDAEHSEIGDELYSRAVAAADERENAIELAKLDEIIADIDNFTVSMCEKAADDIAKGGFKPENTDLYTEKLDKKAESIYIDRLDKITDGFEDMEKDEIASAIEAVNTLNCPSELKQPYIYKLEKAASELAEKEIRKICGDIGSLTIKRATEVKLKLNVMTADANLKNQYLDALDAHIMALEEKEQKDYLKYLKEKITEFNVPPIAFLVPDVSNLFFNKYDEACKSYVSAGRFELPLCLCETDAQNGFTLTTDFLYVFTAGKLNRIKIEDIASFQIKKKGLLASIITVTERNAHSSDLPSGFDKKSIEPVSKAMTALVNYINETRSAAHLKELERDAKEAAIEAAKKAAELAAREERDAAKKAAQDAAEKEEAERIAAEEAKRKAEEEAAAAKAAEEAAEKSENPEETKQSENTADTAENTEEQQKSKNTADTAENTEEQQNAEQPAQPAQPAEKQENKEETEKSEKKAEEKPAATNAANDEPRFCDQCGAKITNPKAKFCAECGNRLN